MALFLQDRSLFIVFRISTGGVDLATWKFTAVEKYDANLNKWESLKSLSENRENAYILPVPISWLDRKITLN